APGWRRRFDRVILVTAPIEMRVARYVDRMASLPGAPSKPELEADARRRIAAQIPDEEKIPLSDFVIRNDDSMEATRLQVEGVYAELAGASKAQARNLQNQSRGVLRQLRQLRPLPSNRDQYHGFSQDCDCSPYCGWLCLSHHAQFFAAAP